mmetsp:Transcript_55715/g.121317  ORF Transcript_55715/g.121317 Transcript_55715/m.121317 type:complete len:205 (-) Transcript_55715:276-890(-)
MLSTLSKAAAASCSAALALATAVLNSCTVTATAARATVWMASTTRTSTLCTLATARFNASRAAPVAATTPSTAATSTRASLCRALLSRALRRWRDSQMKAFMRDATRSSCTSSPLSTMAVSPRMGGNRVWMASTWLTTCVTRASSFSSSAFQIASFARSVSRRPGAHEVCCNLSPSAPARPGHRPHRVAPNVEWSRSSRTATPR